MYMNIYMLLDTYIHISLKHLSNVFTLFMFTDKKLPKYKPKLAPYFKHKQIKNSVQRQLPFLNSNVMSV